MGWLARRPGKGQGEFWSMAGGAGGQGLEVVEQEAGHGLRHWGGRVAEPECDVLAVAEDVVDWLCP